MTRRFKDYNKKTEEDAKKLSIWEKMTDEYTISECGFRFYSQVKMQWARHSGRKYAVTAWHVEFVSSISGKNVSCSSQSISNPENFLSLYAFCLTDKIQGKTYLQWIATINGMQSYKQDKKNVKIQSCKQAFLAL
tara:strand:+ start:1007 stop:1411 length:405 start_codon:yes stop_codon:yes gene_type:complete